MCHGIKVKAWLLSLVLHVNVNDRFPVHSSSQGKFDDEARVKYSFRCSFRCIVKLMSSIQTIDKHFPVVSSAIRLGSDRPNHLTLGKGPPEIQG